MKESSNKNKQSFPDISGALAIDRQNDDHEELKAVPGGLIISIPSLGPSRLIATSATFFMTLSRPATRVLA